MSRTEKLTFALSTSNRGKVITPEAKTRINELLDKKMLCKDIFNTMKIEKKADGTEKWIGLKYQNVRSYIERELNKESKNVPVTA
jgi:hypothetical protein